MYLQSIDDGLRVLVCLGVPAQVAGQGLDIIVSIEQNWIAYGEL